MDIDKLARLTRINLSGEEKEVIVKSLDRLIAYFDDILAAEPDSAVDDENSLQELAPAERLPEPVDFLFESAPILERDGGRYFLIPRVIE